MKEDKRRHKALKLPDGGTALVIDSPGFSLGIVGADEAMEVTDKAGWADMHKKLKTGKLDFATVKKEHISRKPN